MASYYVRSLAAGAGTGVDWANAYTTIALALSGKVAGDVFYLSEDHSETTAGTVALVFPGNQSAPNQILCVDHSGSVPPVSADLRTTAVIANTTSANITIRGYFYMYGVNFTVGAGTATTGSFIVSGATASGPSIAQFSNCFIQISTTSGTQGIFVGSGAGAGSNSNAQQIVLTNTKVQFNNVSQKISIRTGGQLIWRNTSAAIAGSVFPTNLFVGEAGQNLLFVEAVDLSALSTGKTIANPIGASQWTFKDCKLDAAVTKVSPPSDGGAAISFIRCDSGATNYIQEKYGSEGALTTETTIVRTGGASDGTTTIAWKVVTSATDFWQQPFNCFPITIWNDIAGVSQTYTIQGIWGGGAVPKNDEIWLTAEYLGSALTPQGSYVSQSKADILAAGANLPAGSGTWGGSTTKFALTVTMTPAMKGPVTLYVRCAKPSTTFYIDPLVTVT